MLKLATCFSGIGAIEHALNRMGIDNKIVFACDNGDVDILNKIIPLDLVEILQEFENLKEEIRLVTDDEYKFELENDLHRNQDIFWKQKNVIDQIDLQLEEPLHVIFHHIADSDTVGTSKRKEYGALCKDLKDRMGTSKKLLLLQCLVKVANDFHKSNSWAVVDTNGKFNESYGIDWAGNRNAISKIVRYISDINGRKILKNSKDVCERLGMLHGKIHSLKILKIKAGLSTYLAKKKYIDSLYEKKEAQNQVKKTYMANYEIDERHFHWNVSFIDGKEYSNNVDLLVGGSPCQSFSLVGKQRGLEDTRGTLFYEYARLIDEIRPKVFIYENVRAILSNDNGRTWETISAVFSGLDYSWSYAILNAKDYGIPQNRERVFVVGFRGDLTLKKPFKFPEPIKLVTTMRDFLLDNVSGKYYLPSKGVDFVTSDKNLIKKYTQIDGDVALCQKKNQQFNWHGDFVFVEENKSMEKTMHDLDKYFLSEKVCKYVLNTGTKGFYSKPETDLDIARPLLTTMHKMHRAGVDNYVTTNGRLRKLTPRECLRLMGFSDSFKIVVSDTAMYQQAGNSIVVDVLIHIMRSVLESCPQLISSR